MHPSGPLAAGVQVRASLGRKGPGYAGTSAREGREKGAELDMTSLDFSIGAQVSEQALGGPTPMLESGRKRTCEGAEEERCEVEWKVVGAVCGVWGERMWL